MITIITRPFFARWTKYSSLSHACPRLASAIEWVEETNPAIATSTLLVEFQEALCFFVGAIELAMLYATTQGATFFQVDNWAMMNFNRTWMRAFACQGAWAILLAHISLHRVGLDSMYCLLLATLAALLSLLAAEIAMNFSPSEVYELFKDGNSLSECGDNPSRRNFCTTESLDITLPQGMAPLRVITAVLVVFCLHRIYIILKCTRWFNEWKAEHGLESKRLPTWIRGVGYVIVGLCLAALEGWCAGSLGIGVVDLVGYSNTVDGFYWNVGQVVTVLVWAPVLAKYVYLVVCKLQASNAIRGICLLDLKLTFLSRRGERI